jgi:hypothetical protein
MSKKDKVSQDIWESVERISEVVRRRDVILKELDELNDEIRKAASLFPREGAAGNGTMKLVPKENPLRAWRKREGLSISDVAHRLNMSRSSICYAEAKGTRRKHVRWLEKAENGMTKAMNEWTKAQQ